MLAAVTRLQLRSWRFLIPFMIHASRSQKQAARSAGCLGVATRKTRGLAFWTLTMWESDATLRTFLSAKPHRDAMPKLSPWCDEAAAYHWQVETRELPSWDVAGQKLLQQGRLLRVRHPSQAQKEGRINVA